MRHSRQPEQAFGTSGSTEPLDDVGAVQNPDGAAQSNGGAAQSKDDAPEGPGRALGIAYSYLNRRERTVAEVRSWLQRAEIHEQDIEAAIAELVEFGYLDDGRYARVFAEDKQNLEDWGLERIERALRERGVDRDLIAAALDGNDSRSELSRAVDLLVRRFPLGSPTEQRDRERAFGVLIRKGYDSDLAADAVRVWRTHLAC